MTLTKKMMEAALLAILLSFVASCTMKAEKDLPLISPTKLSGNTILKKGWAELPIPISISKTVPEEFRLDCQKAMELWNAEAGTQLFEYRGIIDSAAATDDDINAIYWDKKSNSKGYFGETHKKWVNEGTIVEADITFFGNPSDFASLHCPDGSDICSVDEQKKDLLTTALHELGHVLGFVHTTEKNHLMNPDFGYGDIYQHFDDTILSELTSLYNPPYVADASH